MSCSSTLQVRNRETFENMPETSLESPLKFEVLAIQYPWERHVYKTAPAGLVCRILLYSFLSFFHLSLLELPRFLYGLCVIIESNYRLARTH